ncbi:hypothetical protein [Promicromonospora sp. NPDC050249]|uniref:hypothetical protein n=1 Tax=Promicromonospora sp. NPDC050249 TaxID=3154743 RepID=UPI0034065C7B
MDGWFFKAAMFIGFGGIAWIYLIGLPRELARNRRSGWRMDVQAAIENHEGDVPRTAAMVRSVFPSLLILPIFAIHCLIWGVRGSEYVVSDWTWCICLLAVIGVWIVFAREFGWQKILVPEELRTVPGLMFVRIARWRGGDAATGESDRLPEGSDDRGRNDSVNGAEGRTNGPDMGAPGEEGPR